MKKLILSVALLIAVPSVYAEEKLPSAFGIEFGMGYTDKDLQKIGAKCSMDKGGYIICDLSKIPKPYADFSLYRMFLDEKTRRPTLIMGARSANLPCQSDITRLAKIIELNRGINLQYTEFPDGGGYKYEWTEGVPMTADHRSVMAVCGPMQGAMAYQIFYGNHSGDSRWPDTSGL